MSLSGEGGSSFFIVFVISCSLLLRTSVTNPIVLHSEAGAKRDLSGRTQREAA
jgi:hypothetical protein